MFRRPFSSLNRYSRAITQPKDHGASQAMLYATDPIHDDADLCKPFVAVASVWYVFFSPQTSLTLPRYEGNPCNKHLLAMGTSIKHSLAASSTIPYQYGTVGVSDGISMGTFGMAYSLQSRDLIADAVETATAAHHLDATVVVPGCDKNMPGVLIARQSPPPPFPASHSPQSPVSTAPVSWSTAAPSARAPARASPSSTSSLPSSPTAST